MRIELVFKGLFIVGDNLESGKPVSHVTNFWELWYGH